MAWMENTMADDSVVDGTARVRCSACGHAQTLPQGVALVDAEMLAELQAMLLVERAFAESQDGRR